MLYNALLKQRNALLKQYEDRPLQAPAELFEVLELQMVEHALYIYDKRTDFIQRFIPAFQAMYTAISGDSEQVSLQYVSQLQERDLQESLARTRQRDLAVGWTTQGVHKDELDMRLGDYPLKRVGSQGQQKSYLLAMKLGQAIFLGKPILLLDDIFDKLDAERVERIIRLVSSEQFGQIFVTDTDTVCRTQTFFGGETASCINSDKKSFRRSHGKTGTDFDCCVRIYGYKTCFVCNACIYIVGSGFFTAFGRKGSFLIQSFDFYVHK
jgi:recombinational DNA repair ATPase RecF